MISILKLIAILISLITWSKRKNLRPFEQYVKDYLEKNIKSNSLLSDSDSQTLEYLKCQIVNFLKHEKNEYDERALEYSERALNIDPTCVDVLINQGVAASRLGRLDIAIESYSLASKYDPMNDETHEAMGYILNKIGDYKKAIDCLTKAIELNPKNYNALNNRAVAFYQEGDFDSALLDSTYCVKHGGPSEFYYYLKNFKS